MQRCRTWKFLYISSVLSLFVAYTPRLESSPSFFNRLRLREGKTALLRMCKQSQLFSSSFSVFSKQLVESFSKHREDANDIISKQRFLFPREIAPLWETQWGKKSWGKHMRETSWGKSWGKHKANQCHDGDW